MLNLTPLLKFYAKKRISYLERTSAANLQLQTLLRLLKTASTTEFGFQHDFSKIRSVADYQKAVPLRRYENFWSEYWQAKFPHIDNITWPSRIKYFAASSGTSTGSTKYIPISDEMLRSNSKAGLDLMCYHLHNRANSKIFAGKSLVLGGSSDLVEKSPGIYCGDLSGIAVQTLPAWAKLRYFPRLKLALIKNWEEKIETLAHATLKEDIRSISGVPAWLLLFFNKLFELRPDANNKLHPIFPNLEMLVHGGVSFAPYEQQFRQLLEGSNAELREVYPASEGFIATADRSTNQGLKLNLDNGIFFEFVPLEELNSENPTRHWLGNIQKDLNYAIILTTCAGLWSYIIGDTVKFIECDPARLIVTGRTSYYLSAFGEHLTGDELEHAVMLAATEHNITVVEYSVGAIFPKNTAELGGHVFVIEAKDPSQAQTLISQLAQLVDEKLCQLNEDYQAHRAEGFGLKAPEIILAKSGMFNAWMKQRGKLGGQNKVPRVISDQSLFSSLVEFNKSFVSSDAL